MTDKLIRGNITFIHHEKNRAVIEYMDNGKKKTVQADISETAQEKMVIQKVIKKTHRFLVGDQVKFQLKKTGSNGRVLYADNVQYQYNTVLEILVNKAKKENKFLGYIKKTDDVYFIKEIDTYLFFPLTITPFEVPPTESEMQQPVSFKLENLDKPDKVFASLYNHAYTPEFLAAIQHFKKKSVIDAVITKITQYGIYIQLVNGKIEAKLSIDEDLAEKITKGELIPGSLIPVQITHLTPAKIAVKKSD